MIGTFTRISLVALGVAGFAASASARDAGSGSQSKTVRPMKGFKPSYQATTNVAGPERPYTWPVNDRYGPVSRPYFGRSY
ncbi:hypothetical protein QO012_002162 [Methylobacterium aerolatum]|uniref:Transmembrane protein n=1 Tax=Methylobacterium aerolatum TaxID=418708 RepID=A0ABU0HZ95_9HYPH|nr:hypothetical protein [Methylobacterium aerolatum]GJD34762.1 hypothetical protein FMGBMHLM_1665 [Methylobacterium aerolatum]